jgi:hypothetical protein
VVDLIEAARRQLVAATQHHNDEVANVARRVPQANDLLVAAGSTFGLFSDAGRHLAAALPEAVRLDTDDPRTSSTLTLADAASTASAVVVADVTRRELPGVVSDRLPWITWIASERQPTPPASNVDAIVLADAAWQTSWQEAGWPANRIRIAGWGHGASKTTGRGTLLAYDLPEDVVPPEVERFSSQRVVWEMIADELRAKPFALQSSGGPSSYLVGRLRAGGVEAAEVNLRQWQALLIVPNFVRGIGKMARRSGATLAGRGWHEGRDVSTSDRLGDLVARHAAVIDPTPTGLPATASLGLPIIHARSLDAATFASRVKQSRGTRGSSTSLGDAIRSLLQNEQRLAA